MTDTIDGLDELDEDLDVFEQSPGDVAISLSSLRELPNAGLLSVEDADSLLRWRKASVVAVVGEKNGGKTTLISEIYARFLLGYFANYMFSHSLTLMGFEEKGFQSRVESGLDIANTPRTSAQEGLSFFHLQVADLLSNSVKQDLLISERAGETYKEIRDNPKLALGLLEIVKCGVIVLIIDGERVRNSRERAGVFASIRNIVRALIEYECIQPGTHVQLVTTKFDLLQGDDAIRALEALTEFEVVVQKLVEDKYRFSTHHVAARDPRRVLEPVHGVGELLRSWLEPKLETGKDCLRLPALVSEFDKLALRRS